MRIGGVGAGCDDGAEGQVVRAVIEHKGLELGTELLLRVAGTDELAHMGECGVGDGLRVAHELDLLGVLDGAHELEVAVHEREARANRAILEAAFDTAEEVDVHVVLDGDDAALGGAGVLGNPAGHVDLVHIELPGATGGHVLLERVEVARVGVQEALVGRDERHVRVLAGVVEDAHGAGEPTQVGLVAHDYGVVAALGHEGAQAGDAPSGTVEDFGHIGSFLAKDV